jgi:hypothetical protein
MYPNPNRSPKYSGGKRGPFTGSGQGGTRSPRSFDIGILCDHRRRIRLLGVPPWRFAIRDILYLPIGTKHPVGKGRVTLESNIRSLNVGSGFAP